jgi:hypothetical protein
MINVNWEAGFGVLALMAITVAGIMAFVWIGMRMFGEQSNDE